MTRDEAYDEADIFTNKQLGMNDAIYKKLPLRQKLDKSDGALWFIDWLYDNNYEIVDRTVDEDTAAALDNELSGEVK